MANTKAPNTKRIIKRLRPIEKNQHIEHRNLGLGPRFELSFVDNRFRLDFCSNHHVRMTYRFTIKEPYKK